MLSTSLFIIKYKTIYKIDYKSFKVNRIIFSLPQS